MIGSPASPQCLVAAALAVVVLEGSCYTPQNKCHTIALFQARSMKVSVICQHQKPGVGGEKR
jgi:hypothetical protein